MPGPQTTAARCAALPLVALLTVPALAQEPLPEVKASTIWIGTVEHGSITKQVRGPGVLERFGRGFHAHVRIASHTAGEVELDQSAIIDTRSEKLDGRVVHIADRVEEGTLTVIVELGGDLPDHLRPGLPVDGRIQVGELEDVLYVSRPAFVQPDQTTAIFKLGDDQVAERVQVRWGSTSVEWVVVADGLDAGDRIILSDMSRYDSAARVRLTN